MHPRLISHAQDELIESFKSLSLEANKVFRPGWGTLGKEIEIRANFFVVKYPPSAVLYDYKVKFEPEVKPQAVKARLLQLLEAQVLSPYLDDIVHDSAQRIVSRRPLPLEFPLSIQLAFYEEYEDGPRSGSTIYKITIEKPDELKAGDLDEYLSGDNHTYDCLRIVSALNLITSHHARHRGVRYCQNRYFFDDGKMFLTPGLEAWKGFFTSVRPVYKQLMVNVNVCMAAFHIPQRNLAEAYLDFTRQSKGAVPNFLTDKVKITTTHRNHNVMRKIFKIGDSAKRQRFQCAEYGGMISVKDYFSRKHGIQLRHLDLPCINIGSQKRAEFVPMELCELTAGEPFRGALDKYAVTNMIRIACNPPNVNVKSILVEGLPKLGFRGDSEVMKRFGIEIESTMALIPARFLPPPTVSSGPTVMKVADGSWDVRYAKVHRGATLRGRAVLVAQDGGPADFESQGDVVFTKILDDFKKICRSSGINLQQEATTIRFINQLPKQSEHREDALEKIRGELDFIIAHGMPDVVLVFLSKVEKYIYPGLKKLCDVTLGVPTVCMLCSKVRSENNGTVDQKKRETYLSNVVLKVNAKLGGINHRLDDDSLEWLKDTMLVGIDVTHPGYGTRKGTPSIVAMVASCDDSFMQYPASIDLRKHRVEITEDESKGLEKMMVERLHLYKKKMDKLPSKIIVFRDGVSEGQFEKVNQFEVPPMQGAFKSFDQKSSDNNGEDIEYKPALTVVICGKRHHARMFATAKEDTDKTANPKAGLVVDRGITAVYDFDFYLQAHAGLQGTTRSTHYTVVYDENKLTADEIQQGTNTLCYLWGRATKSVSLAPPAYWADIACERGRCYIHEILPPPHESPDSNLDEAGMWNRAHELWGNGLHENLKDTMFYM